MNPIPGTLGRPASEMLALLAGARLDVVMCGAKGDGVADDTAAIQAALTKSQHVYFPGGNYLVTAPLTMLANQRLYGGSASASAYGSSATGVKITGKHTGNCILDLTGVNGCTVENITLVGADTGATGPIKSVWGVPTAGGSGYAEDDELTITTGGADATVLVTGVDESGAVTSIFLQTAGTGYTAGTGQATSGGGGAGCTVEVTAIACPRCGIYQSRVGTASAGQHNLRNVTMTGSFTDTGLYIVASEVNDYLNLAIDIRGGGALYNIMASGANDLGFTPPLTLGGSTEINTFHGVLTLLNYNTQCKALIAVRSYTGGLYSWTLEHINMALRYGAYIWIDVVTGGFSGPITFRNMVGELIPPAYVPEAVQLTQYPAASGFELKGLVIEDANLDVSDGGVFIANRDNLVLRNARIRVQDQGVSSIIGATAASVIDLGTGEVHNSLTVRDDTDLGSELVTNGDFGSAAGWTVPAGWAISGGAAHATAATGSLLQDNLVVSGRRYKLTYTISNHSSGNCQTVLGGTLGRVNSADGTFTEYLAAGDTYTRLEFYANGWTGDVDDVSLMEVVGGDATVHGNFGVGTDHMDGHRMRVGGDALVDGDCEAATFHGDGSELTGIAVYPALTGKAGFPLRVKDDESGVEWSALTTANVADSADKRYCTDAQKTVIGNTSGTNTGDQDLSGLATKAANLSDLADKPTALANLGGASAASITTTTLTLAKITAEGASGTLTLSSQGIVTNYVAPT